MLPKEGNEDETFKDEDDERNGSTLDTPQGHQRRADFKNMPFS